MMRSVLPLGAFTLLVIVFLVSLRSGRAPNLIESPLIGKPAPEFELQTLRDPERTFSRSDLLGQVSLVNVWATWCVECRHEHEFLMEISRSGLLPIYGLNWKNDRGEALRWLEVLGDPYLVTGFDDTGRVGIDWGVYGAPETFLVGPDGQVLYKRIGALNEGVWRHEILPLIQQAQVAGVQQ